MSTSASASSPCCIRAISTRGQRCSMWWSLSVPHACRCGCVVSVNACSAATTSLHELPAECVCASRCCCFRVLYSVGNHSMHAGLQPRDNGSQPVQRCEAVPGGIHATPPAHTAGPACERSNVPQPCRGACLPVVSSRQWETSCCEDAARPSPARLRSTVAGLATTAPVKPHRGHRCEVCASYDLHDLKTAI